MILSIKAMWRNLDFIVYWSRYSRQGKEMYLYINNLQDLYHLKVDKLMSQLI